MRVCWCWNHHVLQVCSVHHKGTSDLGTQWAEHGAESLYPESLCGYSLGVVTSKHFSERKEAKTNSEAFAI